MKRTETIVIGGGQAGLAMSQRLSNRGIDHVVFERGRIAERWRSERWDSLRLLTPNWMSRLPAWSYRGLDPNGFMTMPEVIDYLGGYATAIGAPVQEQTSVLCVEQHAGSYRVTTDQGTWASEAVVIATGHAAIPQVPAFARQLSGDVEQLVPTRYRNPSQLSRGAVLVVGASASGVQLADELRRSGREVFLSVGRHSRMPRHYRGRDIMWWLDRMGSLDRAWHEIDNLPAARMTPSLQLIGSDDGRNVGLGELLQRGVRLLGRAQSVSGGVMHFADDLGSQLDAADHRLNRLLSRIDRFAGGQGERPTPVRAASTLSRLDLASHGVDSIVWATGFRRRYPWLAVPVLDARGEILHDGGITPAPGLYVLGLQLLRRRNSSFIDGVGGDAHALADHIHQHLGGPHSAAA